MDRRRWIAHAVVLSIVVFLSACASVSVPQRQVRAEAVRAKSDGTVVRIHETGRTDHLAAHVAAALGVPADVERWDVWEFVRADVMRMTGCPVAYFGRSKERAHRSGADVGVYHGDDDWYVALDC
jgi:hypothetical protein